MAEDTKNTKPDDENKNLNNQNSNAADKTTPVQYPNVPEAIPKDRSLWWLWVILAVIVIAFIYWWVCKPAAETEVAKPGLPESEFIDNAGVAIPEATEATEATESLEEANKDAETTIDETESATTSAKATASAAKATKHSKVKGTKSSNKSNDEIDRLAQNTIKGKYGNGPQRKKRLGADYKRIQARVNQRLHHK